MVLWDVPGRRRIAQDPLKLAVGSIQEIAIGPGGKILAASYERQDNIQAGGVALWSLEGPPRPMDGGPLLVEHAVRDLAFSPDGRHFAAGYHDKYFVPRFDGSDTVSPSGVFLWRVDQPRANHPSEFASPIEVRVTSLAFSPDSSRIAAIQSRYDDFRLTVWDVATRKPVESTPDFRPQESLMNKKAMITDFAFHPDGKTLAVGYRHSLGEAAYSGVTLWDMAAGKPAEGGSLPVAEASVQVVKFSPDGRYLAAGCPFVQDSKLKTAVILWDVNARRRMTEQAVFVRDGSVGDMAFSPDGKCLAAGFGVGGPAGVALWEADLDSWIRRAGAIANRNLTRDEFREYLPDEPSYRPTFPALPIAPAEP